MILKNHIGEKFARLIEILDRLRGKNGCPWDQQQDERSILNYLMEEAFEVVDAIEAGKPAAVAEELGDLMMEIVFLARIFQEKKMFSISEVLEGINRKMIERHPHVFGKENVNDASEVVRNWNKMKNAEKERDSVLDGLGKSFPALHESYQIGQRVSANGFDWSAPADALAKLKEEIGELEDAMRASSDQGREGIVEEIGDVLFSVVNVSRHLGVNPEVALKQGNKKFKRRFRFVEESLRRQGKRLEDSSLEEMDAAWDLSKKT